MRIPALTLLVCLLLAPSLCPSGHAQTNGIFADFDTSMGTFTCSLDFSNAPVTVANFIGLADGQRNWLNLETGKVERRPFYDGLLFHRVVTNFVIQAGSPSGDGSDGPGYTFPDEFSTNLLHNAAGVLSMANSGLNSNGSQFFITLAVTQQTIDLDFVHSVFGHVTAGQDVVQAIGSVPVGARDRPLDDVVIHHIAIRRVGPEAQGFNIHTNRLPEVQPAPLAISANGGAVELQLTKARDHEYWLYSSADTSTWIEQRIGLYVDDPTAGNLLLFTASPVLHLLAQDIHYPGPLHTPETVRGRELLLRRDADNLLYISVDETGGGIFQRTALDGTPRFTDTFDASVWSQQAYRGILWIPNQTAPIMKLHFAFEDAGGGFFRGSYFGPTYEGPFVLLPP